MATEHPDPRHPIDPQRQAPAATPAESSPGEAAWEDEGGAPRAGAARALARTYAETLARYEAERRGADLVLLRRMALRSEGPASVD